MVMCVITTDIVQIMPCIEGDRTSVMSDRASSRRLGAGNVC